MRIPLLSVFFEKMKSERSVINNSNVHGDVSYDLNASQSAYAGLEIKSSIVRGDVTVNLVDFEEVLCRLEAVIKLSLIHI